MISEEGRTDTDKLSPPSGYLLAINFTAEDWSLPIARHPAVVGRGSAADVRLEVGNLGISRRHARFWADHRLWVEDLGSTYGTFVRRVRLKPRQRVTIVPGDRILLGRLELEVLTPEQFAAFREREALRVGVSEDSLATEADAGFPAVPCLPKLPSNELFNTLTKAEREVLIWLMRGHHAEDDIAAHSFRSSRTVHTHLNNIFRKLGVHTRYELMAVVLRDSARE